MQDKIYIIANDDDTEATILTIDNIRSYICEICTKMNIVGVDIDKFVSKIYPKLKDINSIKDVENQVVIIASEMVAEHYDYSKIAIYILITNLHEATHNNFLELTEELFNNTKLNKVINATADPTPADLTTSDKIITNIFKSSIVSESYYEYVKANSKVLNRILNYENDFNLSVFGFRTLEKSYLKRSSNGKIIERPQHMFMRVAIAIHYRKNRMDLIIKTYKMLSKLLFTHATPTLFNAGTLREQMSSCFLLGIEDDMEAVGECWKDSAIISKYAGGLGINIANIRVNGAYINSTQGKASGMKLVTVFNEIARYADQGGKRAGSIAIYVEPWHGDIFFFLDLKKNTGAETERARDLFLALMINDIFMQRVEDNGIWSLMCPSECPNLINKYGTEFTKTYINYESQGKYLKQISARDLWFKIMETQIETGIPYIIFKDAANYKSNQINIGVINGSNLCAEILEVSNSKEYAVCFTADTEIITKNGIKKIIDCDGQDVLSYYNNDVDLCENQHYERATLVDNGIKTVYAVKTNGNQIIKATANHLFLVLLERTETKINRYEWKKLKNLVVGDKIMTPRINTLEKYKISRKNFDVEYLTAGWMTGDGWISEKLLETKFGFKRSVGPNKRIDDKIKNSLPIKQASFLSAYFSADGCVIFSQNKMTVALSSASEKILYDVQSMLIPFGINSRIRFGETKSRPGYYQGTLTINGKDNIDNFEKYINFGLCPAKANKLQEYMREYKRERIQFSDYSNVISIEKLNEQRVYDLVLNRSHNFIANGHIVHNCNLASICLPKYIYYIDGLPIYNYKKLFKVSKLITRNLNSIIDVNFYPVDKAKVSNLKHRPIGVGVQGLADVFAIFKTSFDSDLARDLNKKIFETIYFGTMTESMKLAREEGHYETFKGSPLSEGKFQFDLWNLDRKNLSGMWDWDKLMKYIQIYGVRNSLTTACMPTASTSQIMGNNECLVGDTKIFSPCGLTTNIKDFQLNNLVVGFNGKNLENSTCYERLDKGIKDVLKLTFEDGREIRCTSDHKFLTMDKKWVSASDLNLNEQIIAGVDGTYDQNYGDEDGYQLVFDDYIFKMDNYENRYRTLAFARIYGYITSNNNILYDADNNILSIYVESKYDIDCIVYDLKKISSELPKIIAADKNFYVELDPKLSKYMIKNMRLPFVFDDKCPKSIIREFLAGHFGGNDGKTVSTMQDINKLFIKLEFESISKILNIEFVQRIGFRYCINKILKITASNTKLFEYENVAMSRFDTELPYFGLKLISKISDGRAEVFDINVKSTHSFLANGMMVHNCIEAYTSNIYSRTTLAGDHYIVNKHLMDDLIKLNLWNSDMIDLIRFYDGSIQQIETIPNNIKNIYRTVWEIPQKSILEMAADRGPFVDQTQSMNIHFDKPDFVKLNSSHFYAWRLGLKTGIYYLRSKPASEANQFGTDTDHIDDIIKKNKIKAASNKACVYRPKHLRKDEDCLQCSS